MEEAEPEDLVEALMACSGLAAVAEWVPVVLQGNSMEGDPEGL